jgi:methanogenic corrinoid protein MtbC1
MNLSKDMKTEYQNQLHLAIQAGSADKGIELARNALDKGLVPVEFFEEIIQPVLEDLGDRFSRMEVFLPELMRGGMVVKAIQEKVLEPIIHKQSDDMESRGKIIIGTCKGDIHDIGKNMVALMLQVNGFSVVDLGTSVSSQDFIEAAKCENADIIAMSTLITPSMPFMKDVITRLDSLGLRDRFKIITGGAPVTREWANEIGADGFGEDAVEAVEACRQLMDV